MPDPRPLTAAFRWECGPGPDTWTLFLGDREVGWVGLHPNPDFAAIGWWSWRAEDDRARAGGTTDSAEAARRACEAWVTGRLTGGVEGGEG